nr:MADF and Serine threonine protein kinase-related domain containing protein [Haemonchus contortus]
MTKRPSLRDLEAVEPPAKAPCVEENENDDHPRPLPASIISTLIAQIQHHPCIWDHDHEFFGRREQIDSAWRSIAEQTDVQEDHVRSLWNTVWNSCSQSTNGNPIFNQLNKMSSTPTDTPKPSSATKQSPPRKRAVCKKVSWSRYDSVNISGHLLMLPRRFANLEIIEAGPSRTVCSGADLLTEENVIIRKTLLKDQEQTAKVYHNLKWGRLLPHPNILSILDAFEAGDSLYTVTDMMDGRLVDIVEEHLNHFVIAKIVYQLLSALEPLHSNGLYHGNITLNSVFINTDAVLKLSSYGDVMQCANEEKTKEDIMSVGSILARLLLEEESFLNLSKIKNYNDLDWRTILQGNTESGLIDFHARNILYLLLGARCSLGDLLRHPYLFTFRKMPAMCHLSKLIVEICHHSASVMFKGYSETSSIDTSHRSPFKMCSSE